MNGFLGFLVVGAIVGGLVWLGVYLDRKRRARFRELAAALQLQYFETAPPSWGLQRHAFNLFDRGHSPRVANVVTGEFRGVEAAIFDYTYVTGHGKHRTAHSQAVAWFRGNLLHLPVFSLSPESCFHKISEWLGHNDIDFPSAPEFSRQYILKGPDEIAARALFSSRVLRFFEIRVSRDRPCVEGNGQQLIFYRPGRTVKPEREPFLTLLTEAGEIFDAFSGAGGKGA